MIWGEKPHYFRQNIQPPTKLSHCQPPGGIRSSQELLEERFLQQETKKNPTNRGRGCCGLFPFKKKMVGKKTGVRFFQGIFLSQQAEGKLRKIMKNINTKHKLMIVMMLVMAMTTKGGGQAKT